MTSSTPVIVPRDAGDAFDFLGTLLTVKVDGAGSGGALTCLEVLARRGFGPPLHRHRVEDELFHVVEGEVRYVCGGTDEVVTAGGTVWLPRLVPHQFQVLSGTARYLHVSTPAGFEHVVAAAGTPIRHPVLPDPHPVDEARLARVCADAGIEVLGPPPPPLD